MQACLQLARLPAGEHLLAGKHLLSGGEVGGEDGLQVVLGDHAVGARLRLLVEDADGALHPRQVDRVTHLVRVRARGEGEGYG